MAAHEAETLVDDIEDAGRIGVAGTFGLALEDPIDEVFLAIDGGVDLEVATHLSKLVDAHLAQVRDVEVVALARSLDLLLLFVISDGGATDGHATAIPAVP